MLAKSDLKPKNKGKKIIPSDRYTRAEVVNQNNVQSLEITNVKSSLHDTEEFIIKDQPTFKDKMPKEANVRRNIVGYEDLFDTENLDQSYRVIHPNLDSTQK